jgi:penicillin-binding protein 1A
MGGKTGTTQNQTDGWFIGMTPEIIVGVWIGGASPLVRFRNPGSGHGSQTAMPVFARFIQKVKQDREYSYLLDGRFNIPEHIITELTCEDFRESKGFLDFLERKKATRLRDRSGLKSDEEQTKLSRFLKNVFRKKDER